MTKQFLSLALFLIVLTTMSCRRDSASPSNPNNTGAGDEEVITTVELHFTNNADTTDHKHFKWEDLDATGPNPATIDSITLKPSTTYRVEVEIKDKTKNPVVDVTHHIEEEANYHRFHYVWAASTGSTASLTTQLTDQDTQSPPQPIGIKAEVTTGPDTGKGTLNLVLKHFANGATKTASINDGEDDVNVTFKTIIR